MKALGLNKLCKIFLVLFLELNSKQLTKKLVCIKRSICTPTVKF